MNLYIFLCLISVFLADCRPQYYHTNPFRQQPRSIEGPRLEQTNFYNPLYVMPQSYYEEKPKMYQTERMGIGPRIRGPARDTILENESSSASFPLSSEEDEEDYYDRQTESSPHQKHGTRILNTPSRINTRNKAVNPLDVMMSDQPASDFVFPGAVHTPSPPVPKPNLKSIVPKCNGSTFCEAVDGYPSEYVASVLKNTAANFEDFLGIDEITTNVSVTTRIDMDPGDVPMCASFEDVVYPQAAQNKDEKWLYIVNEGKFRQGIRVEKCVKAEGACAFSDSLPGMYTSHCKQKYIYRKLLSVEEGGQIAPDYFMIPSCCVCHVRTGPALRFGNPFQPKSSNTSPAKSRKK